MLRFLLSAFSIFTILFATTLLPRPASASRCGFSMPTTLLSLYRTSDSIYIGRYEKAEEGEVTEEEGDYKVVPVTRHFSISSALKGEPRKMLEITQSEYHSKNQEKTGEEPDGEDEEAEVDEESFELEPGDPVLLFMTRDPESEDVVPTRGADGVKKMTPDRLASYEARIRELNGIFDSKKPSHARIVDWLVRLAEDPLTRWEGTYELQRSFEMMELQDSTAEQAEAATPEETTTAGESQILTIRIKTKQFETGDPDFARNLTDGHKQALTRILLSRDEPKKSKRDDQNTAVNGDSELIDLVKRWGDSSIAAELVERLRRSSSDPLLASELMGSIGSMLGDEDLQGVAQSYMDIRWESAEEMVGEDEPIKLVSTQPVVESESSAPVDDPTSLPVPVESNAAAEVAEAEDAEVEDDESAETGSAEEEKSSKKTYADRRNELLQQFLERADEVILTERNKRTAKLKT